MLFLDAEDLSEAGIKKAYDSLARDLGPVYLAARGSGGRMEYLLYTLDRTVEEGESGGYCADWHAEQSRKNVGDLISD